MISYQIYTFLVFGNLNPGSRGSTAAWTNEHANDSGVSGDEWTELELESFSLVGDLSCWFISSLLENVNR